MLAGAPLLEAKIYYRLGYAVWQASAAADVDGARPFLNLREDVLFTLAISAPYGNCPVIALTSLRHPDACVMAILRQQAISVRSLFHMLAFGCYKLLPFILPFHRI